MTASTAIFLKISKKRKGMIHGIRKKYTKNLPKISTLLQFKV